jgi:hypothetical protein
MFDYINQYYQKNYAKKMKIVVDGRPGTITGARGAHLLVKFDDTKYDFSTPVHPDYKIEISNPRGI